MTTPLAGFFVRPARPSDFDTIAAVADAWWGRPIQSALPRLFLDHFCDTSLIVERTDGQTPELVAFLIGFLSPAQPDAAYIHFVGVHPAHRRDGLAAALYSHFFAHVRTAGRRWVTAVTSPVNAASIAFHTAQGFTVEGPVPDYDGPGHTLMHFRREV